MENLFRRHTNLSILGFVLFVQLLGLALQIKVPNEKGSTLLIRRWAVAVVSPFEKAVVHGQQWAHNTWTGYFYLRDVRRENGQLRDEIDRLKLEQVRIREDAEQGHRLQYLLGFKQTFISKTVAAQVIGASGSDISRIIYIDKGSRDGLAPDMAVISPGGIVGKVIRVYPTTAQVLEISDQSSGVGAMLVKSRLQGILKGAPSGATMLNYVMSDEKVETGEDVVTSGGDRIFPKGLPIGKVMSSSPGKDMFLNIRVAPSANLSRIEEVLVITETKEQAPDVDLSKGPIRAADILAERLPSVPVKPPEAKPEGAQGNGTESAAKPGAQQVPPAKPGNSPGANPTKPADKPQTVDAGQTASATPKKVVKPAAPSAAANTPTEHDGNPQEH